jgi:enolase
MIMPLGASNFEEAMQMGVETYHHLKVCQCVYMIVASVIL